MAKTKRALLLFVILSMRHQSVHCLGGPGTPGFIATFFLVTDSHPNLGWKNNVVFYPVKTCKKNNLVKSLLSSIKIPTMF